MDTQVKYAIEIVDNWSKGLKQMESTLDRINRKKVKDPFADQNRSIAQLRENIQRYRTASENSFRGDHIRKYNQLIAETERRIKKIQAETSACADKTAGWMKTVKGVGAAYLLMRGAQAAGQFAYESVMASAEMEKYGVTVKTMLGSRGAANDRMREYIDIAAKTPFQIDQVVQAGNQLQAIGRYNRDNLTNLGDLAAASGKPLEQVMGAYAKLATGQKGEAVNMFRDLLISSEDWAKATGKGIGANGEMMASTEEMMQALPAILKAKGFLGMMGEQSKTTSGQLSNLQDNVFQLKVAIGDRLQPTFNQLIREGSGVVDMFKKWVEVPTAQKIAKEKAELNALVGAITDVNTVAETRKSLIDQLQATYPEFLGSLNAETVSNEELRKKLEAVNREYDLKLKKQIQEDNINKLREKEKKYADQADKYLKSKIAREEIVGVRNEAQIFLKTLGVTEADLKRQDYWDIMKSAAEGQARIFRVSPSGNSRYDKRNLTTEEMYVAQEILAKYKAYDDMIYYKDDQKMKDAERLYNEYKTRISIANDIFNRTIAEDEKALIFEKASLIDIANETTYSKMFGDSKHEQAGSLASEFESIRSKAMGDLSPDEWQRLRGFMDGSLRYVPGSGGGGGNGPGGTDFKKAEDAISGGGRNMKVINITLDSLIANNTNVFEPGQDPAGANDFLDKLSRALTMVVNDVNYMP